MLPEGRGAGVRGSLMDSWAGQKHTWKILSPPSKKISEEWASAGTIQCDSIAFTAAIEYREGEGFCGRRSEDRGVEHEHDEIHDGLEPPTGCKQEALQGAWIYSVKCSSAFLHVRVYATATFEIRPVIWVFRLAYWFLKKGDQSVSLQTAYDMRLLRTQWVEPSAGGAGTSVPLPEWADLWIFVKTLITCSAGREY
ncbi:hypothetical protein BD779DRAFT_1476842 [Infundibulicybe gibba]|nr:hypothetical protein BD779DRAFT_1476842 [Infundibulicybe gibba]